MGKTHDARIESRYANYFKVGFNSFEFLLDFGQVHDRMRNEDAHTSIVAIPILAKAWSAIFADAILRYEREFGPIPEVGEEQDETPI